MSEGRKARQQQVVDVDHIKNFLKEHPDVTPQMLSRTLKLSPSALPTWLKTGKAPGWTQLAIEGLIRRTRAGNAQPTVFVCKVPTDKRTALEGALKAMNIEFSAV